MYIITIKSYENRQKSISNILPWRWLTETWRYGTWSSSFRPFRVNSSVWKDMLWLDAEEWQGFVD